MFQTIGLNEIIVVAVVVLILFGGKKLPELAKGIAEAIKEFRKAFRGNEDEEKDKE